MKNHIPKIFETDGEDSPSERVRTCRRMKPKKTKLTGKAKTLPGKESDSGMIKEALNKASKFGQVTNKINVVTPFQHNPGTV